MAKVKYNNKKTKYDGHTFDSKLEFHRYLVLKQQQKDGLIFNLKVHPRKFTLLEGYYIVSNGKRTKVQNITYTPDFEYTDKRGKVIVEDAKGMETKEYVLKRKFFLTHLKAFKIDEFREVFERKTIIYKEIKDE